jgi:hypothetical protein
VWWTVFRRDKERETQRGSREERGREKKIHYIFVHIINRL